MAIARAGWALLCAFIIYGSLGTRDADQPGIWQPTLVSPRDVAVNVLLYVAFGALGVLAMRATYRRHWRLALRVALLAVLFSASNEAAQLYTVDRVGSLTDIASAAAGATLGAALFAPRGKPR